MSKKLNVFISLALVATTAFAVLPTVAQAAPTVTSVSPNEGEERGSAEVTITGAAFGETTEVKFGSAKAASFRVRYESEIRAVSPPGTGTVDVTVTTPAGTSATSEADRFTYVPPPTVTKVEPNHGSAAGGTSVTITGTNLTGARGVQFGLHSTSLVKVNSATSITAVSPRERIGTVEVYVFTAGGTSEEKVFFTYTRLYKKEGVFLTEGAGGKTFVTGWGTLTLQAFSGPSYVCRDAEGGYIENPVGGVAGVGATELFSSYQCTDSACPTFLTVLAEELPWPGTLVEPVEGEIRAETTGIKQDYQCWASKAAFENAARGAAELPNAKNVFIGTSTPKVEHGTGAGHPGFLEFGPAAGLLEQEGSGGAVPGETRGKIKTLGYKEQELIEVE